jgi:small subunit ribosomal protein S6
LRPYEATLIFRSDAAAVERGKEAVKASMERFSARVIREDDIGERTLAYPIEKQERGHYTLYEIESDPAHVSEIRSALALTPEVMKYFLVRKDPA